MSNHEDLRRKHFIKRSSDRSFGLLFTIILALVGLWPLLDQTSPRWWALAIAATFATTSLLAPGMLSLLNRSWQKVGQIIHFVAGPIITGFMYYLAVVPTGLIMRLLRKDLLRLKLCPEAESYWIKREPPGPRPDSMPYQF